MMNRLIIIFMIFHNNFNQLACGMSNIIINRRLILGIMMEQPRNSNRQVAQKDKLNTILSLYTSKQYLTKYSLYNNLFSSESLNFSPDDKQFTKLYFGKENIEQNELYQYTYFHKRDKKMLLYFFILNFLSNLQKVQMIIFQNGDRINTLELRDFLVKEEYGGNASLIKQLENRVTFLKAETHQMYKLNLHYLPFYLQQKQFLKVVILSDINEFESGDKSSLQRIYKKIPKNLLVLSFKKEIYDYKFIQKASMPFMMQTDEISDHYELHQKVTRNINKTIQGFKTSHHGYMVPIQQIGITNKSLEDTYRSVLIRKDQNGELNQYIFTAWPFELKAYRKIQ